eukprot:jgi/Picsp_1/5365/NSC_02726-R1_ribosomal rna methyltransferase
MKRERTLDKEIKADSHAVASATVDCICQVNHASYAQRLIEYHNDETIRNKLFCNGGAKEIVDLGRCEGAGVVGQHILVLKDIRGTPREWVAWLYGSLIRHSIMRMYFVEDKKASSREDLLERLRREGPEKEGIRLMCHPRSMEQWLADSLPEEFTLHPVRYSHSLQIVTYPVEHGGHIRYSMRLASEAFQTPRDETTRVPGQFCKAAGKLAEAMIVSGFTPTSGIAIDVGAAPGGWTQILAQAMKLVIAIDPAELHESLHPLGTIRHIRKKSQDTKEDMENILIDGQQVDLICCDANRHPAQLKEMLEPAVPYLRVGGTIIVTLKFRGRGAHKSAAANELIQKALGDRFGNIRCLFLLANTANERTAIATRIS